MNYDFSVVWVQAHLVSIHTALCPLPPEWECMRGHVHKMQPSHGVRHSWKHSEVVVSRTREKEKVFAPYWRHVLTEPLISGTPETVSTCVYSQKGSTSCRHSSHSLGAHVVAAAVLQTRNNGDPLLFGYDECFSDCSVGYDDSVVVELSRCTAPAYSDRWRVDFVHVKGAHSCWACRANERTDL